MNCPNCGTVMDREDAPNIIEGIGDELSKSLRRKYGTQGTCTRVVGTCSVYECPRCNSAWAWFPHLVGLEMRRPPDKDTDIVDGVYQ